MAVSDHWPVLPPHLRPPIVHQELHPALTSHILRINFLLIYGGCFFLIFFFLFFQEVKSVFFFVYDLLQRACELSTFFFVFFSLLLPSWSKSDYIFSQSLLFKQSKKLGNRRETWQTHNLPPSIL